MFGVLTLLWTIFTYSWYIFLSICFLFEHEDFLIFRDRPLYRFLTDRGFQIIIFMVIMCWTWRVIFFNLCIPLLLWILLEWLFVLPSCSIVHFVFIWVYRWIMAWCLLTIKYSLVRECTSLLFKVYCT